MTQHIESDNGLTISWDNYFGVIDRADEFFEPAITLPDGVEDFRGGYDAIVAINGYDFDNVTPTNIGILTPAQQLIFVSKEVEWKTSVGEGEEKYTFKQTKQYVELSHWAANWLINNVGLKYEDWDMRSRDNIFNVGIFFKNKEDAIAFVGAVNEVLGGIRISKD